MPCTPVLRKLTNTYSYWGFRHTIVDFISSSPTCGFEGCPLLGRTVLLLSYSFPCGTYCIPVLQRNKCIFWCRVSRTFASRFSFLRWIRLSIPCLRDAARPSTSATFGCSPCKHLSIPRASYTLETHPFCIPISRRSIVGSNDSDW